MMNLLLSMDLKNSLVNLAKANDKIILFNLQLKLGAIYKNALYPLQEKHQS